MTKKLHVKTICFKTKVNESKEVLDFMETQSNLNDTIRYLMEKEIAENGIRDIINFIPARRTIESLKSFIKSEANTNSVPQLIVSVKDEKLVENEEAITLVNDVMKENETKKFMKYSNYED